MEGNELNKSNKLKIIIITALIFLVAIAGISYAYFSIQIQGNDTASSMRLTTANLSLVYSDTAIISGDKIYPSWSQSKTITVENNGSVPVYYNIIWKELLNQLTNDELVISGECTSSASGSSCEGIAETVIPTNLALANNVSIKSGIEIQPGETHTYQIAVAFIETNSNQNYNQNKQFYGTLNIAEGKAPVRPKRAGTDTTTGLPIVKIGDEEFFDITNAINYSSLVETNGNIYNYASDKSILLARYNLYVGQICTSSSSCTPISTTDPKYGLQSSSAKGYVNGEANWVGVVPFSGTNYWLGWTTAQKENIYSTSYSAAPNESFNNSDYSIAYYVEEYIERLGIEGTGRLLTYTEANAMTQPQKTNGARYWLGSGDKYGGVWNMDSDGGLGSRIERTFTIPSAFGVRPVIVVSTSDISA